MRWKILVAGAGQIGSRYVQGMAQLEKETELWVLDPIPDRLERTRRRWSEVTSSGSSHQISFVEAVTDLPASLDLAVIATTADVRPDVVSVLAGQISIRNWILEKILAQSVSGLQRIQNAIGGLPVWVNTPMHVWPLYRKLRSLFGRGGVQARFHGFEGLACNAIHFIDLIARWNQADVFKINTSQLDNDWKPYRKRPLFLEVEGAMEVLFTDGSRLSLAGKKNHSSYEATLSGDGRTWKVQEAEGYACDEAGNRVEGKTLLQSEMTADIVGQIMLTGHCGLPTLKQSIRQHTPYLNALLDHAKTSGLQADSLPIT